MESIDNSLNDILHYGLPGMGIDASCGNRGEKGHSSYIGYVEMFFNVESFKDPSYAYIRNRNIPDISSWEDNSKIRDYRKEYSIPSTDWKKTFPFYDKSYYDTDASSYVDQSVNSPFFKYTNSDVSIDDYIMNNAWSIDTSNIETLPESERSSVSLSAVKIDNTDNSYEEAVEKVKEEWERYATRDTVYPNTLNSSKYHTGDTLYIVNHDTNQLEYYIILTEDMKNCTFEYFMNQNFIYCDSILSEFNVDCSRLGISIDSFVCPDCCINAKLGNYRSSFLYNFIKHNVGDSALSIASNNHARKGYLTLDTSSENMDFDFSSNDYMSPDESIGFTLRFQKGCVRDLYIKNTYTNINVPEYRNDNIVFLDDGYHINSLQSRNIDSSLKEDLSYDISISMDYSQFMKNNSDGYSYGLKIYYPSLDGQFSQLLETLSFDSVLDSSVSVSLSEIIENNISDFTDNSTNNLFLDCFVSGYNMTEYTSRISTLLFDLKDGMISGFTFEPGDSGAVPETVTDDNGISYTNTDFIDFSSDPIVCEECSTDLLITSKLTDSSICDVYVNDIEYIKDSKVIQNASTPQDSWFTVSSENIALSDDSVYIKDIDFQENLPPSDPSIKTLSGYFSSQYFSGKEIGDSIDETESRYVTVTVISKYNNTFFKSIYKLQQPGFENPIPAIDVSILSDTSNGALEKMNSAYNGILCNQFQTMNSVVISGFSTDTWGKYFDNLKLKICFNIGTSEYSLAKNYSYTENGKTNTVNVYSGNDVSWFPGNAIRLHFSVIPNESNLTYDSSVKDINSAETSFSFKTSLVDASSVSSGDFDEWIPLSLTSRLRDGAETCLSGFDVSLQDASIQNIDVSDAVAENPILLRCFLEMSNPIPAEFNFLWQIESIQIDGDIKDIFSDGGTHETFYKTYGEDNIIKSDNVKLIVNPYYLTAAPADMENYERTEGKGSFKWYGSDENIMLSTGIYPLDSSLLFDYGTSGLSFCKKNVRIANSAVDISYYMPKLEYFQDNVKSITVTPVNVINLSDSVLDGSISTFKDYFIDWLADASENNDTSLSDFNTYMQKKLNMYPFTTSNILNSGFSLDYLTIFYNIDAFNAISKNNDYYFYYNDDKIEAKAYDQFSESDLTRRSPLQIEESAEIQMRDTSLLNSIDTWNEEYERSSYFDDRNTFGGYLTLSGDGYLFADSSIDEGQWDDDNMMYTLEETKEMNSAYVPADVSFTVSEADDLTYHPEKGDYFRSLVWTLDWIYPNYITEDSIKKIVPYYPVSSFISYMDAVYTNGFYEDEYRKSGNLANNFTDYIKTGSSTFPDDCFLEYEKFKKTDLVSMQNACLVNNLIPYNLMMNIYPRVSFNVDMGDNCFNILMLQQPTVRDQHTFRFEDTSYIDDHAHWWNLDSSDYSLSDDFIRNISSPWLFNS